MKTLTPNLNVVSVLNGAYTLATAPSTGLVVVCLDHHPDSELSKTLKSLPESIDVGAVVNTSHCIYVILPAASIANQIGKVTVCYVDTFQIWENVLAKEFPQATIIRGYSADPFFMELPPEQKFVKRGDGFLITEDISVEEREAYIQHCADFIGPLIPKDVASERGIYQTQYAQDTSPRQHTIEPPNTDE